MKSKQKALVIKQHQEGLWRFEPGGLDSEHSLAGWPIDAGCLSASTGLYGSYERAHRAAIHKALTQRILHDISHL
jgi:hypothetical protein